MVTGGAQVTVYCHSYLFDQKPKQLNGIHLKYIPTIKSKSLSQPIHSFLAFWHAAFSNADVVLVLNVSNGPFGIITRLFKKPTLINVDGLEWMRPKWKGFGAIYFKWAAKMAVRFMDLIVTDAVAMQTIYKNEFNATLNYRVPGIGKKKLPKWFISTNFQRIRIDLRDSGLYNIDLVGLKIEHSLNTTMYLTGYWQLNAQKELMNMNLRFQWRYRPMSDIFIVFSQNWYQTALTPNALTESWMAKGRSIAAKLVYWF